MASTRFQFLRNVEASGTVKMVDLDDDSTVSIPKECGGLWDLQELVADRQGPLFQFLRNVEASGTHMETDTLTRPMFQFLRNVEASGTCRMCFCITKESFNS